MGLCTQYVVLLCKDSTRTYDPQGSVPAIYLVLYHPSLYSRYNYLFLSFSTFLKHPSIHFKEGSNIVMLVVVSRMELEAHGIL